MKIEIYADGSGQTSNTDGGYGWVMVVDGVVHSEGSGHVSNATNNDMELEGAIQGLEAVDKHLWTLPATQLNAILFDTPLPGRDVVLVSDSQIVLGWASGEYQFKQENKIDKYKQLKFLMNKLNAQTRWVKGHSGDVHNERCDQLASNARKGVTTNCLDKLTPKMDTRIGTKKAGTASVWHKDVLYVMDFENMVMEKYDREAHGKRGSMIEIREEKSR